MACRICGCPEKRWLTVQQVAHQFKCSPKRVRRLIKSGRFDAVKLVREWRIDHRSLDAYVRRDSVGMPGGK